MHVSPGSSPRRIAAATASGIAPRCTGMCSACAIIRPASSNTAVEQSRRSLMLAENAERISTAPISSATARSELPITCSSTFIASAPACRRRSSRRASRPAPSTSRRPARPPTGPLTSRRTPPPDGDVWAGDDLGGPHRDELDLARLVGVAVPLLVRTMERLRELRLERNGQLERLAAIPQVGRPLRRQLARVGERTEIRRRRDPAARRSRRGRTQRARRLLPGRAPPRSRALRRARTRAVVRRRRTRRARSRADRDRARPRRRAARAASPR